jgi:hypothetical protein
VQISYAEFHKIQPEDMANTDMHSFTSLSAAFLTALHFCGHLLRRIVSEMKENVEIVGWGNHFRSYVKNGFHGTKFHGTQPPKGTRWGSVIPDLNIL